MQHNDFLVAQRRSYDSGHFFYFCATHGQDWSSKFKNVPKKNFGDVAHFFYPPTVFLFSFPTTHLFIGCYDHSSSFLHPSPFGFITPVHRSRLSRFNFFGRPKRNVLPTPTFFIVISSLRPWCFFSFIHRLFFFEAQTFQGREAKCAPTIFPLSRFLTTTLG